MQYFDIILFAVIAGVLAVRLYRILGTKSKVTIEESEEAVQKVVNIKKEKEPTKENIITENGEGLHYLKKVQPDFDEIGFLSGASKAFPMLLEAKYKANKKVLISFLEGVKPSISSLEHNSILFAPFSSALTASKNESTHTSLIICIMKYT